MCEMGEDVQNESRSCKQSNAGERLVQKEPQNNAGIKEVPKEPQNNAGIKEVPKGK